MIIQGYQIIAFNWSMVAFTGLLVLNRLHVRVYLHGKLFSLRTWRWSEVFVILAWVIFLGTMVIQSLLNGWDWLNLNPGFRMKPDNLVKGLKAIYANGFLYKNVMFAAKAALLCFYNELITKHESYGIWMSIRITGWINFFAVVYSIIWSFLQCRPISRQWSIEPGDFCGWNLFQITTCWGLHILTDIMVFIIPFFILRTMRSMPWQRKIAAWVMFGIGIVNLATAAITMEYALEAVLNPHDVSTISKKQAGAYVFTIQSSTSIIIVCIPQLRYGFLNFVNFVRKGRSGEEEVKIRQEIDSSCLRALESGETQKSKDGVVQVDTLS